MDEHQRLELTLNPNGVIAPLLRQLKECADSVLFGLQSIELVDEIPPDLMVDEGFFRYRFAPDTDDIATKKDRYKTWLIKKGFEDLVKGIEYSLREAYLYTSVIAHAENIKTEEDINQLKKVASEMHIPAMIEKVEPLLTRPLSYKKEILSINKARTCLVHRGGMVAQKDINDAENNALRIEWVRLKLFYNRGGEEIEIAESGVIDGGPDGTSIMMRKEENAFSFNLGHRIILNYKQFNEFIVTCHHFGVDLADALPKCISEKTLGS